MVGGLSRNQHDNGQIVAVPPNPYEVANNCRTSVQMIQEHYAKWLSPRLTKGLNVMKHKESAELGS
jgi:hypothetical protein